MRKLGIAVCIVFALSVMLGAVLTFAGNVTVNPAVLAGAIPFALGFIGLGMCALPTPDDQVTRMIDGVNRSGDRWTQNTLNPSKDPIAAGIAAKGKYAAGVQAAITNDSFAKGLAKVDKAAMQAAITNGGAARWSGGIAGRKDKILKAVTAIHALLGPVMAKVNAMPTVSDSDAIAKMTAMFQGWKAIRKQYRTG